MENLRLKKLTKVTVGPFVSDVFSKADDPLMEVVRQADDLEEAWAIRWTVDTLLSAGTKMVGGGFFAPPRPQETFQVTLDDPDCAQRGVTEFRHHVAMPHGMFQRIAERRARTSFAAVRKHPRARGRRPPDRERLRTEMDARSIRVPEDRIRGSYAAALSLIQSAEAPEAEAAPDGKPAALARFISPVAPAAGSAGQKRTRVNLELVLREDGDALLPPERHAVLFEARRALAVGMTVGELFVEPLGYLDLGERNRKGTLHGADLDRFRMLVRAKALVSTFAAAAHMAAMQAASPAGEPRATRRHSAGQHVRRAVLAGAPAGRCGAKALRRTISTARSPAPAPT